MNDFETTLDKLFLDMFGTNGLDSELHQSQKAQVLAAHEADIERIIGSDETEVNDGERGLSPVWQRAYGRNELRAEQRSRARGKYE